jgi:hypothetical protein
MDLPAHRVEDDLPVSRLQRELDPAARQWARGDFRLVGDLGEGQQSVIAGAKGGYRE